MRDLGEFKRETICDGRTSEEFAELVASVVLDEYAPTVVPAFQAAHVRDQTRWDAPIIELIKRSSPEDLEAIQRLVKWVASDVAVQILGVLDPTSGAEHCGDVTLKSAHDGEQLDFVVNHFETEARKRGVA
jgi:hypothetical protein